MMDVLKNEIDFLKDALKIELINKGLSYASVYKVYKDDQIFVLKVYKDNNVDRIDIVEKYLDTNQPIPHVIKYGKTESFGFYIIMEYIGIGTLEDNYINLSEGEIYDKAYILGKKHKELIGKYSPNIFNFFDNFKKSEFEKYNQTVELIKKYSDELPKIDFLRIKNDMERLINLFEDDTPLYMHWDLKADNIMVSDEFLMIDYDGGAVLYLPIALRCEVYHIMNDDECANKSLALLKGIISGIDEDLLNNVNLSGKLAYAYLKSAFVYIVGYLLKNGRIEDARNQIIKINKVYSKIDNIEDLIPSMK